MQYWKLTNETECHHNMQYKTGLNVDVVPFNPTGSCLTGGIYFAGKPVLAFVELQDVKWIRRVSLPAGEEVYEDPGHLKKSKAHSVILGERMPLWDVETLKMLDAAGVSLWHITKSVAIQCGNADVFEYLTKKNSYVYHYYDIMMAIICRKFEIVKFLGKQMAEDALSLCARFGVIELVQYFVEQGGTITTNTINNAASEGRLRIIKYLVKHGGRPSGDAIKYAELGGHKKVVKHLKRC